jgi:hypothetical protein
VLLEAVTPNAQLSSVTVSAHEDADGTPATWSVTSTAICANVPGLERVSETLAASSKSVMLTGASCPYGKNTLGAGREITGGNGQVHMQSIDPETSSGIAEAYEDGAGTSNSWSLTAYAICADPPPGYEYVYKGAHTGSATSFGLAVYCSPGKALLGTGGEVGGFGQVGMTAMTAMSAPSQGAVVAGSEGQGGTALDWWIGASAICATP